MNQIVVLIQVTFFLLLFSFKGNSQFTLHLDSINESRCASSGLVGTHATGGARPYLFRYKPQGAPNNTYSSSSNDSLINGLEAGYWTIQAVDNLGAVDEIDITIPGTYILPQLIIDTVIDVYVSGALCKNDTILGSILSHYEDGRVSYSYQLRNGGVNGPIVRPFQGNGSFTDLPVGNYTLQAIDSCEVLRTTVGIRVELNADPDSVYIPLKYDKISSSSVYISGIVMTPTSCTQGTIGVVNDVTYSGQFYDDTNSNAFELNGDTSFKPFSLTGGRGPYIYSLEEVEMHQAVYEFAFNGNIRPYTSNKMGVNFTANRNGFIKTVGFRVENNSTYVIHLKDNVGAYLFSSDTFSVVTADDLKLIQFSFPITSGAIYELELEQLSYSGANPRIWTYYNGGVFPLINTYASITSTNNGGTIINNDCVFNEIVFSEVSNNTIATSSEAKFRNLDRSSDYVIMGLDGCGTEYREYFRADYFALDSNDIKITYQYTNCGYKPIIRFDDFNDDIINNFISNQNAYKGTYPYVIEFLSGPGVLPDPVSIDTINGNIFRSGSANLDILFPNYFPLDPDESYTIRITDACGNFIEKEIAFNLPVKNDYAGSDITYSYCSCFPYISTKLKKSNNEENVNYTIQPLTSTGVTSDVSGDFSWIEYVDLSKADTFLITTTGECSGITFMDTVITPNRRDSSWVVVNNSSCAEFSGGASVDVFYELYIDDSLLTSPCRIARLYEGDPVNGLSSSYLEQRSISNNKASFLGLLPGVYTINFINPCHGYLTFTVKDYTYPELELGFDPICPPNLTGGIYAEPKYGVPPYVYQIKESSSSVYSAFQTDSVFVNMPPGTYDIRMEDSCGNSVEQTISTGLLPKPILSGPDRLCIESNLYITTAQLPGITYRWRKNGIILPNDTTYFLDIKNVTHSDSGNYSLQITSTGCASQIDSIHVSTVDDATILSLTANKLKLCEGERVTLEGINSGTSINGSWGYIDGPTYYAPILYSTDNPLLIPNLSSTEADENNGVETPYRYRWTINTALCEANKDIYFEVFRYPQTAFAGANIDLCNQASTDLNANLPNYWSGHWEFVSGPSVVSFVDSSNARTTINGLISDPTKYVLKWRSYNDSIGVCELDDEVEIRNYNPTSYSFAGNDTNLCGELTYQMNANDVPSDSGRGRWRIVESPVGNNPSISNYYNEKAQITFSKSGKYSFAWEVTNGVCSKNEDTVNIFVVLADVGNNQSKCLDSDSSIIFMDADSLSDFYGNWRSIQGPQSIIFDTNFLLSSKASKTSIQKPIPGLYLLEWNITDSLGCSLYDTSELLINFTVDTPMLGNDFSVCGSEAFLEGNSPSVSSARWEFANGPSLPVFESFDSANTIVSNLIPGEYIFTWNFYNGTCSSSSDSIKVSVIPSPVLQILSFNDVTCGDQMDGNIHVKVIDSTSVYNYYLGQSIISQSNGLFSNLDTGEYIIYIVDTNTKCKDSIDLKLNIFDTIPPQLVCQDVEVFLNNNGEVIVDTSMLILSVSDNCDLLAVTFLNGDVSRVIDCEHDTVWQDLIATDVNGNSSMCSARIIITDTISPNITCKDSLLEFVNTTEAILYPQDLIDLSSDNCNIHSFSINGEDSIIFNCQSLSSNQLILEVMDSSGNIEMCNSIVEVPNDSVIALAGNDTAICSNTFTLMGSLPLNNHHGEWRLIDNLSVSYSNQDSNHCIVSNLEEGVYRFVWEVKSPCDSSKDTIQVIVEIPTIHQQVQTIEVCDGLTIDLVGGELESSYTGSWKLDSMNSTGVLATINNNIDRVTQADVNNTGEYVFLWEKESPVCPNDVDTVIFKSYESPVADFTLSDSVICLSECIVFKNTSTISSGMINEFKWQFNSGLNYDGDTGVICLNDTGIFSLRLVVRSDQGCYDTIDDPAGFYVSRLPESNFKLKEAAFVGADVGIINQANHYTAGYYNILGDSLDLVGTNYVFDEVGGFTVNQYVVNIYGCIDSSFKIIDIVNPNGLLVPNSFSPNGDGINDVFMVKSTIDFSSFNFIVFDRWGEVIHTINNIDQHWDGTFNGEKSPIGVYVWKLEYRINNSPDIIHLTGHVSIIK